MDDTTRKVALTVAAHAHNADDCCELLDMLGITVPKSTRKPGGQAPVEHGHGDYRAYNKGCRCDDCRDAQRRHRAELRAKWQADPSSADRAGHGKASTYRNCGCRCGECTEANRLDCAERRARRCERVAMAQTGGGR